MYTFNAKAASAKTEAFVSKLLNSIETDFKDFHIGIIEYNPDGASTILKVALIKGHSYHLIDLFWSID